MRLSPAGDAPGKYSSDSGMVYIAANCYAQWLEADD